jgi:hypothetical protein
VVRELVLQREALRPAADRVLAVEHELNRLVERGLDRGVTPLEVEPEQQLRRLGGAAIVERAVAPVVLKLLEPPLVETFSTMNVVARFMPSRTSFVPGAAAGRPGDGADCAEGSAPTASRTQASSGKEATRRA